MNTAPIQPGHEAGVVKDAWFRSIVESAPDGMLLVDEWGRILFANREAERMFGYASGELEGSAVESLVPDDRRGQHCGHRARYATESRIREMGAGQELEGLRQDGSCFPVEISLAPVMTEHAIHFTAAIRDISERKRADEALAQYAQQLETSNQELEQFAYVASHDLQAPLRTMLSFAGLLREECADELHGDALQYLHFIEEGASRMRTLISDLLELSKVQRLEMHAEPIDTGSVIEAACQQLTEAIEESGADIQTEVLPSVNGNRGALIQLFQNLIGNAIKFHKPNRKPVVRIFARDQDTLDVTICVEDQGIGIPSDKLDGVFELFRRLQPEDKRYPGSGMGLSICKKIVEKHHGEIWAEARSGGGTIFCCRLPLASSVAGVGVAG